MFVSRCGHQKRQTSLSNRSETFATEIRAAVETALGSNARHTGDIFVHGRCRRRRTHLDGGEVVTGLTQDVGVAGGAHFHGGNVRNGVGGGIHAPRRLLFRRGRDPKQPRSNGGKDLSEQNKLNSSRAWWGET